MKPEDTNQPNAQPDRPQVFEAPQSVTISPEGSMVPPTQQSTAPVSVSAGGMDGVIGMTGSQIQSQKTPLPKGVFVIAFFSAVGFAASFFDTSQNNLFYTLALLASLMLTIGLFLRLEIARKFLVFVSGLTIILCIVTIVLLMGLANRVEQMKKQSDAAFARLDGQALTTTSRQQLDAMKAKIEADSKKFGRSLPFVYAKNASTILVYTGMIVYLTRPKVREAFNSDPR